MHALILTVYIRMHVSGPADLCLVEEFASFAPLHAVLDMLTELNQQSRLLSCINPR